MFLAVGAGAAQAEPFDMSIDNAVLDLGGLSGVRAIDPDLGDPPATLSGDIDGSTVTVPKAGFVFPTKVAELQPGLNAEIDMEANEDITGTFDEATGALSMDVSLKATVQVLGATCVISPIAMTLSSDNIRPYLGEPFSDGIEGEGVVGGSWTGLPPVTGGGTCGIVAGVIAGPGGIAMSHGIHDFPTCTSDPLDPRCNVVVPPTAEPILNSAPATSTDQTTASFSFAKGNGETQPVDGFECKLDSGAFEACDSGTKEYSGLAVGAHSFTVQGTNTAGTGPAFTYNWTITQKEQENCPPGTTGTPPDCVKNPVGGTPTLAALKVAPKNKAVKRGKKATITVKVKNSGDAAATGVKVCVTAPKALVQVKKCVTVGQVAAGATKAAKFKVTVKKKAKKGKKAVLKFKATSGNAGSKAGKATIKVK